MRTASPVDSAACNAIAITEVVMRYQVPKRYREYLLAPFRCCYRTALELFNLELPEGGSLAVLGPNGSGKTTLLRLLGGFLHPARGAIRIKGHLLDGACSRRPFNVGTVLNEDRSFYWRLTGRQNLEFFAALDNLFGRAAHRRCDETLELVGLGHAADVRVSNYSSGMRQRLAIARGLMADPQLLILDEPTKSLDPIGANEVRRIIQDWASGRHGATVILATHSMKEAEQLCTHVCILRNGRLAEYGLMSEIVDQFGDLAAFYETVLSNDQNVHVSI